MKVVYILILSVLFFSFYPTENNFQQKLSE